MKTAANCLLLLRLVIGSTAAAQQPCGGPPKTSVIDWAQYGFVPCHTRFNPYEFVLSPATVGNLGLKWHFTEQNLNFQGSPGVANGVVYIGAFPSDVYALDASTGELLWDYPTWPLPVESSPAVVNGVVYFGVTYIRGGGAFYAVDASTGALIWQRGMGLVSSSPAVA